MPRKPVILVVDDTRADALLLERALSKAGYTILAANGSDRCLELAASQQPDVILLDMVMPGRDGLETCRVLKANPETASISIIFVTGNSDSQHIVRALEAGGSDYVTKPIRIDEILARVSMQVRLRDAETSLIERNALLERLSAQLAESNEELARQARYDALTGLLNRKTCEEVAELEHDRSVRHARIYSVLMLDVDYFKLLNDTQGHQAGDLCLQTLGRTVVAACRSSDIVGRYGGEEFLIIAPETGAEAAAQLGERIRQAVWDLAITHPTSPAGRVTVSIGVYECKSDSLAEVIRKADKALYAAKRSGRNLVCGPLAQIPNSLPVANPGASSEAPTCTSIDFDSRPVVLIVEDNGTNRRLYRGCLGAENYRFLEAENGAIGLDMLKREMPDVILMDVMMPVMDGLECTRHIKANPETRDIPIIIASARSEPNDVLKGLSVGADEYLTKPIRTTELAVRVRSMVRWNRERQDLLRSYRLRAEQIRVLALLLDFCRSVGMANSIDELLDHLIRALSDLTSCGRVSVMLPDSTGSHLTIARCIGIDSVRATAVRVQIGDAIAGEVFKTRQPVVVNSKRDRLHSDNDYQSEFYASVPLLSAPFGHDPEILGVLNVTDRVGGAPFEPQEVEYVELIAGIAGASFQAMRDRQSRDDARDLIVVALARLAEHRDNDTARHVERVTQYALILAGELRKDTALAETIDDRFLNDLRRAVPLHDIGKVAIPDGILRKPDRLTVQEMAVMRTHANIGVDALRPVIEKASNISFLRMASDIIHAHHEWYDGSGYPRGLRGASIPLAARLVAVADVYDALTTDRVYKRAITHEEAGKIIIESASTQFDPTVVEAFKNCKNLIRQRATELADASRLSGPRSDQIDQTTAAKKALVCIP